MFFSKVKKRILLKLKVIYKYIFRIKNLYYIEILLNRKKLAINRQLYPDFRENPLISIRIPTYNRAGLLKSRTIPGILAQTYQHFEVVIVGDYCTDDTEDVIRGFQDPRLKFYKSGAQNRQIKNPDQRWCTCGYTASMLALDRCTGDWIAVMDDDDEWLPHHLEELLHCALKGKYELVYSKVKRELPDSSFDVIGTPKLKAGQISNAAAMYSRRLLFIRYDPDVYKYYYPGDWELWERMKKSGARIGFLDRITAIHYKERQQDHVEKNLCPLSAGQ